MLEGTITVDPKPLGMERTIMVDTKPQGTERTITVNTKPWEVVGEDNRGGPYGGDLGGDPKRWAGLERPIMVDPTSQGAEEDPKGGRGRRGQSWWP